jgi:2-oxoglutarate ferredoxin oxidoreductase subunit alpha
LPRISHPSALPVSERFRQVLTVEVNYSDQLGDPYITPDARRYSQLALLLRAQTLVDVDCWSRVPGSPIPPGVIEEELRRRLSQLGGIQ